MSGLGKIASTVRAYTCPRLAGTRNDKRSLLVCHTLGKCYEIIRCSAIVSSSDCKLSTSKFQRSVSIHLSDVSKKRIAAATRLKLFVNRRANMSIVSQHFKFCFLTNLSQFLLFCFSDIHYD